MGDYHDKQGKELTLEQWSKLFEDKEYSMVKTSRHKERGKEFMLSTVWLGINHNWSDKGDPLIFETMAFEYKARWNQVIGELDYAGLTQLRYSTEAEALAEHNASIPLYHYDIISLFIMAISGVNPHQKKVIRYVAASVLQLRRLWKVCAKAGVRAKCVLSRKVFRKDT